MRLVLYSGGYPEENKKLDEILIELCEKKKNIQISFLPSSSYLSDQEFSEFIGQYKKFNIKRFLKLEVDNPFSDTLRKEIFKSDIIHLGGGNTYYFLKHLRKANLLQELREWVERGGVLTGLSAGAIIMTKNIETAGFPSFDKDENEENLKNLKGMGLVDFEFFPHYRNSKRYDQELLDYSKDLKHPLYACPDGSGIIALDKEIRFIGKTVCFYQGKKHFISK